MIKNKWIMEIIKNGLLIFSIYITFTLFDRTSSIISNTKDDNKLLFVNLLIFMILSLITLLLKRTVITNNVKFFFSILLLVSSFTICFTYYVNYKFGKIQIKKCVIKNKIVDENPKDKSIRTYEIQSNSDEFKFITVSKEFYNQVDKEMEMDLIINNGILGFPVLKEIRGKGDNPIWYKIH